MVQVKKTLQSLLLIVFGLVVGFVLAEGGMALFNIAPKRYSPVRWFVLHDGIFQEWGAWGGGYIKRESRFVDFYQGRPNMGEYVPGVKFKAVYATNPRGYFDKDNSISYSINSLGLRGPEIKSDKESGTIRVLGVGDSFTFGEGVRDEDSFLRRLELSFNSQRYGGKRYEFLNAGVQGYNTADEVLYLERQWLGLSPDVVLINFYLNDAYSDVAFFNKGEGLGLYLSEPPALIKRFRSLDFAQHSLRSYQARRYLDNYYSKHYFQRADEFFASDESSDSDWRDCEKALQRAVNLGRLNDVPIGLVIFPELYKLRRYQFSPIHEVVGKYAESIGLPTLDLLDTFQGRPAAELWVHPTDHHPNEIGHQLAAQAIEPFLKQLLEKGIDDQISSEGHMD